MLGTRTAIRSMQNMLVESIANRVHQLAGTGLHASMALPKHVLLLQALG